MDKTYSVKNRSASVVVYNIAEDGLRREFAPGEVKNITERELEKLSFQAGGRELMQNFLQIKNIEVREKLNIDTEPEYDMSEEQIAELILTGSMDAFLDCLDFAPTGIIDLIKVLAVKLPMTDMEKAEVLKNKTGFDVVQAIQNSKEETKEPVLEDNTVASPESGRRRTNVSYSEQANETKVPQYNVVTKK